uniref:J domain-containing protein n=1 Tax=Panagrolaimus sp. PS1159 TaxID=55785 RepID=A0AC35GUT0_9BILA
MPSLKSLKTSKSAKTTKATTEGDGGEASAERRVVLYEGSTFHTQSGVKLKKNALYELLGVPTTATQNEIKKAYRQKALQLHPDKNIDVLGQINRAYKILSDPTKRKIYDQYGIDAVQTFEETEIYPSCLWFFYRRLGRIALCLILLFTCCFCCFCCCACFCDCFCGCCCNRCCKSKYDDDDDDGYMKYDPEAAQPPPPPKSKLSSIINSISSKRVIKKKKRNQEESGIPMTDNPNGRPETIRIDPRSAASSAPPSHSFASNVQSQQNYQSGNLQNQQSNDPTSNKLPTQSTQEATTNE